MRKLALLGVDQSKMRKLFLGGAALAVLGVGTLATSSPAEARCWYSYRWVRVICNRGPVWDGGWRGGWRRDGHRGSRVVVITGGGGGGHGGGGHGGGGHFGMGAHGGMGGHAMGGGGKVGGGGGGKVGGGGGGGKKI